MEKISIKKFVEEYNNRANESLKKQYIRDNLKITPYVPFITKVILINNLVNTTMINKETGNIKTDSSAEYLLMNKIFIEQYTNLEVETAGFYEEYDELKKSGLFNILVIGNEETKTPPLIPYEEIAEFKFLLAQKRNDMFTNKYEIHSFITEQADRFKALGEATLTPLVDVVKEKLDGLSEEDLDKIVEFAKKGDFREV